MTTEEQFYERYILQIIRSVVSTDLKRNASMLQPETLLIDELHLNKVELSYLYDLFELKVYVDFSAEERFRLQTVRDIAHNMLNRHTMMNLENI